MKQRSLASPVLPSIAVALGCAFVASAQTTVETLPIARAFASSESGQRAALRAGDGSGLTAAGHGVGEADMWLSAGGDIDNYPYLAFDLGQARRITAMRVWNYNVAGELQNGVKQTEIFVSSHPDALVDPWHSSWTSAGSYTLDMATGTAQDPGQMLEGLDVVGRYVYLDVAGNHQGTRFPIPAPDPGRDAAGIAEVRVLGTSLPNNVAFGKHATMSSVLPSGIDFLADNAVDGNRNGDQYDDSIIYTQTELDPWWQVDLGAVYELSEIRLWDRTDCCAGDFADYYVFLSATPFNSEAFADTMQQPGVKSFRVSGRAERQNDLTVGFSARYIRVQAEGLRFLELAELEAYSPAAVGNLPPSLENPGNQANLVGEYVFIDPLWFEPESDATEFAAEGLPPGVTLDPKTGILRGTPTPGSEGAYQTNLSVSDGQFTTNAEFDWTVGPGLEITSGAVRYVRFVALSEVNGLDLAAVAELNVLGRSGARLDRSGWRVVAVSSEENVAGKGRVENIIDGNPDTSWHSEWSGNTSLTYPHEVVVDLGGYFLVSGFQYLPKQDYILDAESGRVAIYQLYMSSTFGQWGAPVASGVFPNNGAEQTVTVGRRPLRRRAR